MSGLRRTFRRMRAEVVTDGVVFGEGPVWVPEGTPGGPSLVVTSVAAGSAGPDLARRLRDAKTSPTPAAAPTAPRSRPTARSSSPRTAASTSRSSRSASTLPVPAERRPASSSRPVDGGVALPRRRRLPRAERPRRRRRRRRATSPTPALPATRRRRSGRVVGVRARRHRCASSPTASATATASRSTPTGRSWSIEGRGLQRLRPDGEREWVDRDARPRRRRRVLPRRRRPLLRRVHDRARRPRRRPRRARSSTSSRSRARASPPTAASAAPTCAPSSRPTRSPATSSRGKACPDPRPPAAHLARPRCPTDAYVASDTPRSAVTRVQGARRGARRGRGPRRAGSSSGQPCSGRSKYSTLRPPCVAELVEAAEHGREVDDAARVVDVHLRRARLALAQLHVVGVLEQLAAGHRPSRRRARCRRAAAAPAPRRASRGTVSIELHDRARPRLEQRAGRGAPPARPSRSHTPGAVGAARASSTSPGCGFGNAVGQPTGNASVAGSTSTSTSMCSNPSAARERARSTGIARPVHDVDDAEPVRARRRLRYLNSMPFGITMPTGCRCWPRIWSKCSATSAGRPAAVAPHPRDLLRVLEDRVARSRCGRGSGR